MTDRYDYEQSPWAMPQQSHSCARAYFFQESHSARLEKQIFLLINFFDFCSENKILLYKSTPRNMKMTSDFR